MKIMLNHFLQQFTVYLFDQVEPLASSILLQFVNLWWDVYHFFNNSLIHSIGIWQLSFQTVGGYKCKICFGVASKLVNWFTIWSMLDEIFWLFFLNTVTLNRKAND